MDDCEIVRLYFDRDELAIEQTDKKYGSRLMHLSARITESIPDSQECVSDTYLAVWKNIPPDRPEHFFAYLAKICRRISLRVCERRQALKRRATTTQLTGELDECIPSHSNVEREIESAQLAEAINEFICSLNREKQIVFMRRYFWQDSIKEISSLTGMTQSRIKSILMRCRNDLRKHLENEFYEKF